MSLCSHCGAKNVNNFYCKGCGRPLTPEKKDPEHVERGESSMFWCEVEGVIESVLKNSALEAHSAPEEAAFDLAGISRISGIHLVGNSQWREISPKAEGGCFFSEIAAVYIFSFIVSIALILILGDSVPQLPFKAFGGSFILFSFVSLFVFPVVRGVTPVAFYARRSAPFIPEAGSENKRSLKDDAASAFMFFLYSVFYITLIPFAVGLINLSKQEKYRPFPLVLTKINYLEKVEE
ncbi:hypothetical protein J5834_01135 [bacterium]|nr:hypothetical protein [bacterium]